MLTLEQKNKKTKKQKQKQKHKKQKSTQKAQKQSQPCFPPLPQINQKEILGYGCIDLSDAPWSQKSGQNAPKMLDFLHNTIFTPEAPLHWRIRAAL